MKTSIWSRLINPFLIATANSYANTMRISLFHLSKLYTAAQNDPYFVPFYNAYLIIHNAFDTSYSAFLSTSISQQGSGLSLTNLLAASTQNINGWDSLIQTVFPKGSEGYKALLAHGHTPFHQGGQIARIAAVKTLRDLLDINNATAALIPPACLPASFLTGLTPAKLATLTDLYNQIAAYYTNLKNAFDNKNSAQNNTGNHSTAAETARIDLCNEQFFNLNTFLAKYKLTPELAGGFFDLEHIRTHSQTDFTHIVKLLSVYTIVQRTLAPTDMIRINNTGPSILRFYAAHTKDEAIGTVFIEAAPGSNNDYAASLLGDVVNNHFIIVYNPDAVQTGSFVFDLL